MSEKAVIIVKTRHFYVPAGMDIEFTSLDGALAWMDRRSEKGARKRTRKPNKERVKG